MSHALLAAAIKTQVDAVTGTGQVHERIRYASRIQDLISRYADTIAGKQQVRTWFLSLDRINGSLAPEEYAVFGTVARRYDFRLHGAMSFKDGDNSESTWFALVEAVMDTLDNETTLGVSDVIVGGVGPCSMEVSDVRNFGNQSGWFCHYAEVTCPIVMVVTV